jgi:hypothetical protein
MTVFKWISSKKAKGELAFKVTGKGGVELSVRLILVADGWSWHTVLFAQALAPVPIVEPEAL